MDNTGIEWTDATWNPVTGCTKVSAGCDHCYAETIAHRFAGTKAYPDGFQVTLRPERLDQPIRWRRPRRIFVNSMADLFHDDVPDEYIAEVFAVMALAPQHTFQVLTKRHARMRSLLSSDRFTDLDDGLVSQAIDRRSQTPCVDLDSVGYPLPNVWLGVSVENQQWADIRVPALLDTPAFVRFLSCEPLLGPVSLAVDWMSVPIGDGPDRMEGVDWVIVGGESGKDARPMHLHWARTLRDQCVSAGVPFLFKQWGELAPFSQMGQDGKDLVERQVKSAIDPDSEHYLFRVGKKLAGRELDGRTWDEYPDAVRDA